MHIVKLRLFHCHNNDIYLRKKKLTITPGVYFYHYLDKDRVPTVGTLSEDGQSQTAEDQTEQS